MDRIRVLLLRTRVGRAAAAAKNSFSRGTLRVVECGRTSGINSPKVQVCWVKSELVPVKRPIPTDSSTSVHHVRDVVVEVKWIALLPIGSILTLTTFGHSKEEEEAEVDVTEEFVIEELYFLCLLVFIFLDKTPSLWLVAREEKNGRPLFRSLLLSIWLMADVEVHLTPFTYYRI